MSTGDHPCRAAAGKNGLRNEFACLYLIGLERSDRKKGDSRQIAHFGRVDPQDLRVSTIQGITPVLPTEKLQGPGGKDFRG